MEPTPQHRNRTGLEPELWTAAARTEEAVLSRRRSASLREHASADASLTGVLVDLAERRVDVVISTIAGRIHRGVVLEVATCWIGLQTRSGESVLLRTGCVATVDVAGRWRSTGERAAPTATSLRAALDRFVDLGIVISILCGAVTTIGELRTVGRDLAMVMLPDGSMRQVSIDAIDEVVMARSSLLS